MGDHVGEVELLELLQLLFHRWSALILRAVPIVFPKGFDHTGVNAQMAVDYATGDVYVLFIDATNQDIYRVKWTEGGGWETEVKVFTATGDADRASYVMPEVFTHASGNGGT